MPGTREGACQHIDIVDQLWHTAHGSGKRQKNVAARELGKPLGVHAAVIDRFLRDEIKPSNEMATQLAKTLEVPLGYQAGSTDGLLEKSIVNKILDIQKLKEGDKQRVFALCDEVVGQTKFQCIM